MKIIKLSKISWLIICVFWASLIFFFSHQELNINAITDNTSLDKPTKHNPKEISLHATEYAILTFILITTLNKWIKKYKIKQIILFSAIISFLYSLTDEYHQSFINGRNASTADILFDSLGILISTWMMNKYYEKK